MSRDKKGSMNIGVYFNKEESEWLKKQPEGTVRMLVQKEMSVPGGQEWLESHKDEKVVAEPIKIAEFTTKEYPLDPPKKKALKPIKVVVPQNGGIVKIVGKGDGLHTCKQCGYMLPYYKGKCKNGCK
jgi:hypothetical protein